MQSSDAAATHLDSHLMKCDVFFTLLLQTRKPLVEKKRRARINESLQELRTLLADTDVSTAHAHCTLTVCTAHIWFWPRSPPCFHSFTPRWRTQRCWRWQWKKWRTSWGTEPKVCTASHVGLFWQLQNMVYWTVLGLLFQTLSDVLPIQNQCS